MSNVAESTAIIILAAGASSRMGFPKQLLDFRGQPLLRHTVETAIAAGCGPVVVVLGCEAQRISAALAAFPVEIVVNEHWPEGMASSIHAGLSAVRHAGVQGAILALADQPFVTPEFLRRLVAAHRESGKPIVASRYSGTVGVPVLFVREVFSRLFALSAGQGCKGVILSAGEEALLIDCPEAAVDIDTPNDYFHACP